MGTRVFTVVKIPISEIEGWVRSNHNLPEFLDNFCLEENNLVLHFIDKEASEKSVAQDISMDDISSQKLNKPLRRAHRKRNRMKTRGWAIVARITNSKGQKCTIYKPFVDALNDSKLTIDEQRKQVEKILRANRNKPSEKSIQYFLENTLEYLKGAIQ